MKNGFLAHVEKNTMSVVLLFIAFQRNTLNNTIAYLCFKIYRCA